jgi:hypothetical protein
MSLKSMRDVEAERDGAAAGERDFSASPIFQDEVGMTAAELTASAPEPVRRDVGEVVHVDHPTMEGAFVEVRVCPFRVKLGRGRFVKQIMTVETDARGRRTPGKTISSDTDPVGLFLYETQHALVAFAYPRRDGALAQSVPGQERINARLAEEFPEWFGSFAQTEIQRLNGWDRDSEEQEAEFRPATAKPG